MRIGIKFCGGCNPRYDRREKLTKLQKRLPGAAWITDKEIICEYWLVCCGCPKECVDTGGFLARKKIIKLCNTADYQEAASLLEAELLLEQEKQNGQTGQAGHRKKVIIGADEAMTLTVDESYIFQFAKMTGDYNRLHMDSEFAKKQWFGQRVAHGMIGVNLLSAVLGTKMPGDGAILLSMDTEFKNPVRIGDEITAKVRLDSALENRKCYIGQFSGECVNASGDILITMHASQMMMKNLFYVEVENNNDES